MKISALNRFNIYLSDNYKIPKNQTSKPAQVRFDTVSFGAMKKNQFNGIDYAFVESFKAPIEKFNSNNDLQNWAFSKIQNEYVQQDFGGRKEETKALRKSMLRTWIHYLTVENTAYTPVMQLSILNAITKYLKPDNDKLPPVLMKGVLADTMSEILERFDKNPKENININKIYNEKLQNSFLNIENDKKDLDEFTGWIVIPSGNHDVQNFSKNVDKLKILSHNNWCTKSYNAEPYLNEGDFHIYLENGQPKLGVRFFHNVIAEIQGEKNDSKIPQRYFEEMKKYIKENNFELCNYSKLQFAEAKKVKQEIQEIKKEIGADAIENADIEKIFSYFGVGVKKEDDGLYTISSFKEPENYSFEDLGINENDMFKKIKKIEGAAFFAHSQVTNLGNLETINGDAYFDNSSVLNLGNLKVIEGYTSFKNSAVRDLGNLEEINSSADFRFSHLKNLGKLKKIGFSVYLEGSQITNLGNLEFIGRNAYFRDSKVVNLGKLKVVQGNVNFEDSQVCDLGDLENVGENVYLRSSKIKDFSNISVGGKIFD